MSQSQSPSESPYRWVPDPEEDDGLLTYDVDFDDVDRTVTGSHDEENELEERGVFVNEVQRDSEICTNCFLKNYDIIHPYTWRFQARKSLIRYFIPYGGTTESFPHAASTCSNPPRACKCGRVGSSTLRPLTKELAVEYAHNLSETLARKGIEHNPLLLTFVLTSLKSDPSSASRDDSNFDEAVARSLSSYRYDFNDLLHVPNQQRALPAPDDTEADSAKSKFSRHRTMTRSNQASGQ